jgi:transcriptional regulator with XRE-family HTH domain
MSNYHKGITPSFNFAEALNKALMLSGRSQYWLARELDVSAPYIAKLSGGASVPSVAKSELIAKSLGFSLSDFIKLGE